MNLMQYCGLFQLFGILCIHWFEIEFSNNLKHRKFIVQSLTLTTGNAVSGFVRKYGLFLDTLYNENTIPAACVMSVNQSVLLCVYCCVLLQHPLLCVYCMNMACSQSLYIPSGGAYYYYSSYYIKHLIVKQCH